MNQNTTSPTPSPTIRIAMWSGPRNISTAMMRSWENRNDTFVTDEPFYACYLAATGINHPMREKIIASQPTDWQQVAASCTSLTEGECTVHYQKHMTQHMLPQIKLDWLKSLVNIFLIRSPEEVVSSYARARSEFTVADLGFEQQHRLFQYVVEHIDSNPLVIASKSVLQNPEKVLTAICKKAGIDFNKDMLCWPPGRRASDGVWAPHWYANVEKSTEFSALSKPALGLNPQQQQVVDQCQKYYSTMQQHTL